MSKVKCNNCDGIFDEEDLTLFETKGDGTETITAEEDKNGHIKRYSENPNNPFFFKGCPTCKTDGYLMDIETDDLPMDWEPDYDGQPRTQKPFGGHEPIEKPL